MTFGERVVALRKAAGFKSAAKLAVKVKISQPSMWAIENGETNPDDIKVQTFMRLVAALRTNAQYLYFGVGPLGEVISPDLEEAEAASIYRQLRDPFRAGWVAAGHAMVTAQPVTLATDDNPFPKARKRTT